MNGWSNRETWLVNIWFNPECKSDLDSIKEQIDEEVNKLPNWLQDFVSTSAIDWDELRDSLEDDEQDDDV